MKHFTLKTVVEVHFAFHREGDAGWFSRALRVDRRWSCCLFSVSDGHRLRAELSQARPSISAALRLMLQTLVSVIALGSMDVLDPNHAPGDP